MNKVNVMELRKGMDMLDNAFHFKLNVIKLNANNTYEHEIAKCILALEILKSGKNFYSEAIFKNNKRADIFLPEEQEAHEILKSETKEMFEKKVYPVKTYPHYSKDQVLWFFEQVGINQNEEIAKWIKKHDDSSKEEAYLFVAKEELEKYLGVKEGFFN